MTTLFARADAARIPLADGAVDLVFGSPPYCDARTYGIGAQRDCLAWVEWMLSVTTEARRVSRGPVVWVAAGVTRDRNYWPACEGLMWEWWRRGGDCQLYRPCYWHRVGIPGSGGDDWFRADVEYVMCFKGPGPLPWSDNTAMGHKPKWAPGGDMSNRTRDGRRVDGVKQWKRGRRHDGHGMGTEPSWRARSEVTVEIANPGNLIHTNAGGGHTGPKVALAGNEAPFPEALVEHFIRSLCPEGGTVLDAFSGSGTTASVAARWGRKGLGFDLRMSQCRLGRKRYASQATMFDRPDPEPAIA